MCTSAKDLALILNASQIDEFLGISQSLTYQLFQQKDFSTIQIGHKTGMSESPTGMAGRSHRGGPAPSLWAAGQSRQQSAFTSYRTYVQKHFALVLGRSKLCDLTPRELQYFCHFKQKSEGLRLRRASA